MRLLGEVCVKAVHHRGTEAQREMQWLCRKHEPFAFFCASVPRWLSLFAVQAGCPHHPETTPLLPLPSGEGFCCGMVGVADSWGHGQV